MGKSKKHANEINYTKKTTHCTILYMCIWTIKHGVMGENTEL